MRTALPAIIVLLSMTSLAVAGERWQGVVLHPEGARSSCHGFAGESV